MTLRDLLRVLGSPDRRDGRNLTHDEAFEAFHRILNGAESEIQIAAFLMALRWKGVTVEELTGFARAARSMARLPCSGVSGLVCVCPPQDGYDRLPPLELAAGLIAAGAGARVLLISDRGVPPRRGVTAASALEYLGVPVNWDPSCVEDLIEKNGFAAVAASGILPQWLELRRVRAEVGVRTPLSTIEKLVVPESAALVIGAQNGPVLGVAVETMAGLGHERGIAIQGVEGGVVPTLKRRTRGIEVIDQRQVPLTVEPADFGLSSREDAELPMYGPPEDGQGTGDNPWLIRASGESVAAVLAGQSGPARNATLLASAVILKAAGRALTLAEGVDLAVNSLDSGAGSRTLEGLRKSL